MNSIIASVQLFFGQLILHSQENKKSRDVIVLLFQFSYHFFPSAIDRVKSLREMRSAHSASVHRADLLNLSVVKHEAFHSVQLFLLHIAAVNVPYVSLEPGGLMKACFK